MQFNTALESELKLARIKKTKKEWLEYCSYAGGLLFVVGIVTGHVGFAPLLGVGGFAVVFAYPSYRKKELAGKIERELPLALRSMATLLSAGMPFEDALKNSCGEGELGKGIRGVLRDVRYGSSLPTALSSFAESVDSRELQKAVMIMSSIYLKKGNPMQLKKSSMEISALQKSALEEYSGKLVVYSLVFVAVSAIVPALFQAYVIMGSSFMAGMVTAEQALWIPVIGFPIVDMAMLAIIRLKKPFFA